MQSITTIMADPAVKNFTDASCFTKPIIRSLISFFIQEVQSNLGIPSTGSEKASWTFTKDYAGNLDLALVIEDSIIMTKKAPTSVPKNDTKRKSLALEKSKAIENSDASVPKKKEKPTHKKVKITNIFGVELVPQYKTCRFRFKLHSHKGFGGYRWSSSQEKTAQELLCIFESELKIYKDFSALSDGYVVACDPNDKPTEELGLAESEGICTDAGL
jgi:hypothetical protein